MRFGKKIPGIKEATSEIEEQYRLWLKSSCGNETNPEKINKALKSAACMRPFFVTEDRYENKLSISLCVVSNKETCRIGAALIGTTANDADTRRDASLLLLYIAARLDELQYPFMDKLYHNDIVRNYLKNSDFGQRRS